MWSDPPYAPDARVGTRLSPEPGATTSGNMADADGLAAKFARVDASFAFLARHRAALTVRNVLRLAASLGGPVTRADLARMARLAPRLLRVEPVTGGETQHKGAGGALGCRAS